MSRLSWVEDWAEGPAARIEALLPVGVKRRQLSVKAFLVASVLTKLDLRDLHFTIIWSTLKSFSPTVKQRLGVPDQVTYRHVERLANLIVGTMDPTPVRTRRAKPEAPLTDAERLRREEVLEEIIAEIIENSIPEEWKSWSHYAVDWTDVDAWASAKHKNPVDPTAEWWHRKNKDHGQDEDFFGYLEQVLTMVNAEGGERVPELVRATSLTPAKTHQAPVAFQMLERHVAAGLPVGDLLADSAYPYAKGWTLAVQHTLGFDLIASINSNDLGERGIETNGAIVVDDLILCPETPPNLIEIAHPGNQATPADWAKRDAAVALRDPYTFVKHSGPDHEGYFKGICPARAGKCCCPRISSSVSAPATAPTINNPGPDAPKCCTTGVVTFDPRSGGKIRQKHTYNTPKHRKSFERRSTVERSFSTTTDRTRVDLTHGTIRLIGVTKNRFMRAIGWVAANYRALRNYHKFLDKQSTKISVTKRTRSPRRATPVTDALNEVRAPQSTGPPGDPPQDE